MFATDDFVFWSLFGGLADSWTLVSSVNLFSKLLIIVASSVLASAIAAFLFWKDKRAASRGSARTPEKTLLLFCVLGGWPGGYLASQQFRHKTQKGSFRFGFVIATLVHLSIVTLLLIS